MSFRIVGQHRAVRLVGEFRMPDAPAIWLQLTEATATAETALDFDLRNAEWIDGGVMALLVQLRAELAERGIACSIEGANQRVEQLVELYHGDDKPVRRRRRKPERFLDNVGRTTAQILAELRQVVAFLGRIVIGAAGVIRRPSSGNWRDILPLIERSGADAVPIILLINFLVGFVMGYQSATQLRAYGANIYVADLVGLAITRELAPLMTAIVICGRSGAAMTAEIGSMKVSEEIDALRTMGFEPIRYLVLPRAIALMIVTPALTLLGDLVGVAGGLLVGVTSLDLSASAYINETLNAVHMTDVLTGILKSGVFAVAISLIACQNGFATSGGAEGVGKRTTSTVVTCLFAIVLLDAVFTVVFRALSV